MASRNDRVTKSNSFPDNLFSNDERLVHINNFNTIISEG